MSSIFETLNAINVNGHTEKKNNLTYLSWAWAWGTLKKHYPNSYYTIYENGDGWNYFTDGRTAWVKTGVTAVDGETAIEHIEYLPVMDYRNQSIPAEKVTSFDVNKSIQRSLTKAAARHGLGLYIYAGEDLPEDDKPDKPEEKEHCADCGAALAPVKARDGSVWDVETQVKYCVGADGRPGRFGRVLCPKCQKAALKAESGHGA